MLKTMYDEFAKKLRNFHVYDNQPSAKEDADLMNSMSTIFKYKPYQGQYYWHVVTIDPETNYPICFL